MFGDASSSSAGGCSGDPMDMSDMPALMAPDAMEEQSGAAPPYKKLRIASAKAVTFRTGPRSPDQWMYCSPTRKQIHDYPQAHE
jgi:hypothetical protein